MRKMFEVQKEFLQIFFNDEIGKNYYFTGGTALSIYYFNHRKSDDIDLFCEDKEALNLQNIGEFFKNAGIKILNFNKKYDRRIYNVEIDNQPLKVEFVYYPFVRLFETNVFNNVRVDSLLDIITNKISALCEREEEKDIFDIAFFIYKEGEEKFKEVIDKFFPKKFNIPGCRYIVERAIAGYEGKFEEIKLIDKIDIDELIYRMKKTIKGLIEEDIKNA